MNTASSQFSPSLADFENFVGYDVVEKDRPLEIISDETGKLTLQQVGAWNGHVLTDETSRHQPAIDALVSALKKEVGYSNDFTAELRAEAETHGLTSHILEQVFENRDTRQTAWRDVGGLGDNFIMPDNSPPDIFKELLDQNRADSSIVHLDSNNNIDIHSEQTHPEIHAPRLFFWKRSCHSF